MAIAKLLVKAGSNIHAEDDEYNANPAGWAQHAAQNLNRLACLDVVGYLETLMARNTKVTKMPPRKQTMPATYWKPIMDAAFAGDATQIVKLIEAGRRPERPQQDGRWSSTTASGRSRRSPPTRAARATRRR